MWFVPEHCGVCGTPANPAIRCSGPCQKSFHLACVNIESLTPGTGWVWFCSDCLPDVRHNLELRADGASGEIQSSAYRLPPEVWERILQPLSGRQLLHVRRTCRYLRNVVDGCRQTRDKLTAHFLPCTTMDRMYTPAELPAVAKATWDSNYWTKIVNVDHWWPEFGQRLTHISFGCCEISLATLLNMLRHTPNLTVLTFKDIECDTGAALPDLDFQLHKMQRLHITDFTPDVSYAYLETLASIFPCLKSFQMLLEESDAVLNFVYLLQYSLEELELEANDSMIIAACRLEHLKLKKLTLFEDAFPQDEDLLEVCRLQPLLEEIRISGNRTNEVLCEVGRRCTKLKRLSVCIDHDDTAVLVPTFLNSMVELKHLDIYDLKNDDYANINFEGITNVHLTKVCFDGMQPIGNNLQIYLQKASQLTSISICGCKFHSWSELFTILENVKLLEDLQIYFVTVELTDFIAPVNGSLDNLKHLEVRRMANNVVNHLLSLCPILQELHVCLCDDFSLHTKLHTLKKLTLENNDTINLQRIMYNCRQIQELNISRKHISTDSWLKKVLGAKLTVL